MYTDDGFDLAHEVASSATAQIAELTAQFREERERTARLSLELAEVRGHARTLRLSVANAWDTLDAVRHELTSGEAGEDADDAGRDVSWCVERIEEAHGRLADALAHTKPVAEPA